MPVLFICSRQASKRQPAYPARQGLIAQPALTAQRFSRQARFIVKDPDAARQPRKRLWPERGRTTP
jgi:hypothetical protein